MKPAARSLAAASVVVLAAAAALPWIPATGASEGLRVASLSAPPAPRGAAMKGEIIVQVAREAPLDAEDRLLRMAGAKEARRSAFSRRYLVSLEDGVTIDEALRRLRGHAEVEFAEPNGVVRAFFKPNDRLYFAQWHWRELNAERTWDIQRGASTVGIAVLDSGIAYEDFGPYRKAPDFGSTTFLPGYDFVNRDTHPNDDNFHGTHVASVIAQSTNNSEGAAGLAFECALMPVKVLDEEGVGSFFGVAEGIDYAVNYSQNGAKPVKVINMSLGGESPSEAVRQAVDRAVAAGVTVVAAAGNEDVGTVSFPANLSNVIAVGALDGKKRRAPYSNYGSALDLMAFGGDLDRDEVGSSSGGPDGYPDGILQQTFDPDRAALGIFNDFAHYFVVGTSQAAPQVAALAGLLYDQGITQPAAIQASMQQSAEDLGSTGRDDTFGYGLIRPDEALKGLGLGVKK